MAEVCQNTRTAERCVAYVLWGLWSSEMCVAGRFEFQNLDVA